MRLFIFAIGGTGSRIMTSFLFQLAAGVRPKDANGEDIKDLSVVPIIIDPHEGNAGLQQLKVLLNDYRSIRKRIYGDANLNAKGFFAVKVETLKEVNPVNVTSDTFYFKMQEVSDSQFEKLIDLSLMNDENNMLARLLFSKDELDTSLREGFYGSPNIGCVALSEFKNSSDFDAFRSAYHPGDKLFFIGSIFGGTGAAGLPLFISSIRDLGNRANNDNGKIDCAKAPIGALIVMPYFSIAIDEESRINDYDFRIKTRSALRYYYTNLNKYLNNIYYVADPLGTNDFENDPGNINNQNKNKAHIVEFVGALAIMDFVSDYQTEPEEDSYGRMTVREPAFKAFGLKNEESYVHFTALDAGANSLCMRSLIKFQLLKDFMKRHLLNYLTKPFAAGYNPKLEKSIMSRELNSIFEMYDKWMEEMKGHGSNAHNLDLFSAANGNDYSNIINGISTKKGALFKKKVNADDIKSKLDKVAQRHDNMESADARWYTIANEALDAIIDEYYDVMNLDKE